MLVIATSSMIQAAGLAPALRRRLLRSVTSPASSLRSVVAAVRWSAVGPGGGVCGAVARTKRRSDNIRAGAVVPPLRCAAFRHVGARRS